MSQYYLLGSSRQDKVNKPFKILHLTRPILAMIMNICILKSYEYMYIKILHALHHCLLIRNHWI